MIYKIKAIQKARTLKLSGLFLFKPFSIMTVDSVLKTVEKEAISTFSLLDGWFDEEQAVLDYRPQAEARNAHEILVHAVLTCSNLMEEIEKGSACALECSDASEAFDWNQYTLLPKEVIEARDVHCYALPLPGTKAEEVFPIGNVRVSLRAQLLKCLEQLDLLQNGEGVRYKISDRDFGIGDLDIYQYLYFLTQYGKWQLDQLRHNKKEYLSLNA
jgi:hypothetical protein